MKTKRNLLLICGLLLTNILQAQNFLRSPEHVIMQFDISPDERTVCCSWLCKGGVLKVRLKNLKTNQVVEVDSINQKERYAALSTGICFLSNIELLYAKGQTIYKYELKTGNSIRMFDLSEEISEGSISFLVANKEKNLICIVCYDSLYIVDFKGNVRNVLSVNPNSVVTSVCIDSNNKIIFSSIYKEKGQSKTDVLSWDMQQESAIIKQMPQIIEKPYIVESIAGVNRFVVVDKNGLYMLDRATQEIFKLMKNSIDTPITEVRGGGERIYYRTRDQKSMIFVLGGESNGRCSSIEFETNKF